MSYNIHTLKNGIRIIHKHSVSNVAHCGIILNVGSRDEKEDEWGIAHFIEHVVFKGTHKRDLYGILNRLEDVGGELNAYTAKEETCIYATFLNKDYNRALDLISDITFNSIFPEKELKKEKDVIIEEINSYKDNPAELIFDDFEEIIFANQPIGRNILGIPENIKKFNKEHITQFINNNYHTDNIVISSVGNIDFKKLVKMCEKYFDYIPQNLRTNNRIKFEDYKQISRTIKKNTYQTHCIIGNIAYDSNDDKRTILSLLNNILGGPGLNSKLNIALREKHGLVYNIESNYTPYTDTGIFNIYFGTDIENLNKCIDLTYREINKLRNKEIGIAQLNRFKNQMIGQLTIASENQENYMLSMGKSYLLYNKVDSLNDFYRKIEAISAKQIIDVANEIFDNNKLSTLIYN